MRRVLLVTAAFVAALSPRGARAQRSGASEPTRRDSTRMAVVTYVSGQSVYVSAGRAEGVREGTSLEALHGGTVIATLRATFLSSHSSSCEVIAGATAPTVGDSVRYHPSFEPTAVASGDSARPDSSAARSSTPWRRPVRGHIGVGYLDISQPNAFTGGSMRQPSADVYVEAADIGGTPVGVILDARTRHTVGATSTDALDGRTLFYQVSVSVADPGTGARMSIGRQYSTALSSVSLFDGVTAEVNRARWGVGLFGGVQPDVTTMEYSSAVREAGGYVQLHNGPTASFPWSVTAGGADSRDLGQLNREFGFAQVTVNSRAVSLFATQEVDVNRGWKRTAGEPAWSPTSTFATLSVRPTDAVSLDAGIDNRRNVRLYRDYVNPVTEFDDAYRQGWWAGASARPWSFLRIGGNARTSRGGPAGRADYYTATLDASHLSPAGVDVQLRSTSYSAEWSAGWLHAMSASIAPFDIARLEISGGLRTAHDVTRDTSAVGLAVLPAFGTARWIGASLDVNLGSSWYFIVSAVRDGAGSDLTNQLYSGISFRF